MVRGTMSIVMSCAAPHSAEAARNSVERELEQPLAAVAVAELAPQRRRRGGGDDVGGDDPRDVGEAPEIGGDRRQRGGQDRLVEHRREHREDVRREGHRDPRTARGLEALGRRVAGPSGL